MSIYKKAWKSLERFVVDALNEVAGASSKSNSRDTTVLIKTAFVS